jgi:hypothetical protein
LRTESNRLPARLSRLASASALLLVSFAPRAPAAQSGRAPAGVDPSQVTQKNAPQQPPALKRTTTRQETRRFAYGGRVTVYGAPQGSVTVEAWPKAEVEVSADIELQADTEEDLARLASVNDFVLDDDLNFLTVATVGTHDRQYMKRAARDFPKRLLGLPWKIDYRIRVPAQCDLDIYTGRGALKIDGVEGALHLAVGESDPVALTLAGGDMEAIVQGGTVNFDATARSWRGRGVNLRLIRGDINLTLPAAFNGYVNAEVLRAGRVENTHPGLAPVERTKPTDRSLRGQAGNGGATLSFTVGDGTIRIKAVGSRK